MEDLVIEIDNPIQLRGDTLVYDAKAFSTGREVVVEDLLKNIPGITVEKDGKIKFEDTEIEKVMTFLTVATAYLPKICPINR